MSPASPRTVGLSLLLMTALAVLVVMGVRDKAMRGASDASARLRLPAAAAVQQAARARAQLRNVTSTREASDDARARGRAGMWMLDDPALPAMVADVLVATRFPPDARPLTKEAVDLLEPNRRYDASAPLVDDDSVHDHVSVLFTGDRFRLLGNDTLNASIEVQGVEGDAAAGVRVVRVLAKSGALAPVAVTPVVRTGPAAFALGYTAAGTALADLHGQIVLDAEIALADGATGHATLVVEHQPEATAPARFTGSMRDELSDGSLLLHVEVDVAKAGTYRFDANVFDAGEQPVAAVLARVELAAGLQNVTLRVFGRIVREAAAQAPFTITDVRGYRFAAGQDPDREHMRELQGTWTTQRYALDDFSPDEHWDEKKERRVRRLLEQAAHGPKALTATLGTGIEE